MLTPLREIYQDPAIHYDASCHTDIWRRDGSIERSLERAGDLASITTQEALIEHVELLPEYDHSQSRERAAVAYDGPARRLDFRRNADGNWRQSTADLLVSLA